MFCPALLVVPLYIKINILILVQFWMFWPALSVVPLYIHRPLATSPPTVQPPLVAPSRNSMAHQHQHQNEDYH